LTNQSLNIKEEETRKIIHWAIDSSKSLRNTIKDYFSTLNVNIQDLSIIRDIFRFSDGNLLYHVDKIGFLVKSLTNSDDARSSDFYSKWFSYLR
jgi:hypothetical protein